MQGGQLVADGRPTELVTYNRQSTTALALHLADAISFSRFIFTPGVRIEVLRGREERLPDRHDRHQHDAGGAPRARQLGAPHQEPGPRRRGPPRVLAAEPRRELGERARRRDPLGGRRALDEQAGARRGHRLLRRLPQPHRHLHVLERLRRQEPGPPVRRGRGAAPGRRRSPRPRLPCFRARRSRCVSRTRSPARACSRASRPRIRSSRTCARATSCPYLPRHQLSGMVAFETKRFGVAAQGLYVGRMRETAGQGAFVDGLTTDASFVLDVSGSFKVNGWLRLHGGVRNLLDQAYLAGRRPFGARPLAPRTFQVGAQVICEGAARHVPRARRPGVPAIPDIGGAHRRGGLVVPRPWAWPLAPRLPVPEGMLPPTGRRGSTTRCWWCGRSCTPSGSSRAS